jgi:hypothetical protein
MAPIFLKENRFFNEYLELGKAGKLKLPPYETVSQALWWIYICAWVLFV